MLNLLCAYVVCVCVCVLYAGVETGIGMLLLHASVNIATWSCQYYCFIGLSRDQIYLQVGV
jgi:hypothetical protein